MRVSVVPAASLGADEIAAWSRLQASEPMLSSPFLRPEWAVLVAHVRPDVRVGLVELDDGRRAFFPFQRDRLGVGWPAGGMMSNAQALIGPADAIWDPVELVRRCGLNAFEFDHLIAAQRPFARYQRAAAVSPCMDLSEGFEAYVAARRATGCRQTVHAQQLRRRMEREVGPLRFVAVSRDHAVLEQLLRWKDAHHERTRRENVLRIPWIEALLGRLVDADGDGFGGVLSALYAGDRLVAASLGLRTATVWQGNVLGYDIAFHTYSPGIVELLALAEAAPGMGIRVMDLGKGQAPYKEHAMTHAVELAEGRVEVPGWQTAARHARLALREMARHSPFATQLRQLFVGARRRGWLRE